VLGLAASAILLGTRKMSRISSAIGVLMVIQTLAWLIALAVN
jgi:hypothetical protein